MLLENVTLGQAALSWQKKRSVIYGPTARTQTQNEKNGL